jgi:large subunit ribosomal protein L30
MAGKKKIKVTQVRSIIHCTKTQRDTVASLGLKRIRHSRILEDSPVYRGMVAAVPHLVTLEEIKA